MLIAAQALALELTVVSGNLNEFMRVPGSMSRTGSRAGRDP